MNEFIKAASGLSFHIKNFVRYSAVHLSSYMEPSKRKKQNDRTEFRVNQEVKEAKAIVDSEHSILISKKDKEIFFYALMGKEEAPNEALISAFKFHKNK